MTQCIKNITKHVKVPCDDILARKENLITK
jgi:hypothetical protein